jgi:hypothetical protein
MGGTEPLIVDPFGEPTELASGPMRLVKGGVEGGSLSESRKGTLPEEPEYVVHMCEVRVVHTYEVRVP